MFVFVGLKVTFKWLLPVHLFRFCPVRIGNKLKLFFFVDSYYSFRKVKIKSLHCLTFIKFYHSREREDTTLKNFRASQYTLVFRCTRSVFAFTNQYCCTRSQFESEKTILYCTPDQNSLQTLQPSCPRSYSKGIKRNNNSNRKFSENL